MPVYPTDAENNNYGTSSQAEASRSVNNVTTHREAKVQIATGASDSTEDVIVTDKKHGLTTGDPIKFTFVADTTSNISTTTQYYAITTDDDYEFAISLSATGAAVNLTTGGSDGVVYYYSNDGILTGAELTGVTETLKDLANTDAVLTLNGDKMPTSASGVINGNSVLATLVKEITLLYDQLDGSRSTVAVTSVSGSTGTIWTSTAHGLTTGVPIAFVSAGNTGVTAGSDETKYTVSVVTANTFKIIVVSTGSAYTGGPLLGYATYYIPLTTAEKNYLAQLKFLKFNYLQDRALDLAFELKRFTAEVGQIRANGLPGASRYPSGDEGYQSSSSV